MRASSDQHTPESLPVKGPVAVSAFALNQQPISQWQLGMQVPATRASAIASAMRASSNAPKSSDPKRY
jgi:hypothetical protein